MIRTKLLFFKFLVVILFSSCDLTQESSQGNTFLSKKTKTFSKYNFFQPDKVVKLSNKLQEISGLTIDNQYVYAVNDERGNIYCLDKGSGKILKKIDFGKSGDYEGVELVKDKLYVVKSSGTIYEVFGDSLKQKVKYDTPLKTKNDVEGLAYDATQNILLLACKANPNLEQNLTESRAIYAFDLNTMKLQNEPQLIIRQSAIADFLEQQAHEDMMKDDLVAFVKRATKFAPSAIALHPKSKNYYILSSVGKLLLILSPNGSIQYIEFLDKNIFKQPEGICFDQDGTLYISSEGAGAKAKIFTFFSNNK